MVCLVRDATFESSYPGLTVATQIRRRFMAESVGRLLCYDLLIFEFQKRRETTGPTSRKLE